MGFAMAKPIPRAHSGLMPADLITLAHLSISAAMNFPNSADAQ